MSPRLTPDHEWWTAEEIAAAGLPDLPGSKRGVNDLATRNDWRSTPAFARRRAGKGGGWEYSWQLFPQRARRKLLLDAAPLPDARPARDEAWAWFESLPATVQGKARERLHIIQAVEAMERADGRYMAVASVAKLRGIGARTIWDWLALIEGVRPDDRLAYLAPRHRAATTRGAPRRDCDPEFFDLLKSDYLRLEAPPFTDCYRRSVRVATAKGWAILPLQTMRRRMDEAVSAVTQVLARQGIDAVRRLYPVQVRDKTCLGSLEAVNADFHKFDVFVAWPGAKGEADQILRPQMVAFQDIFSGRILAWRVDVSPNSTAVLLCAGDMITDWGIPEHVLLDNGREFAAKSITGGASTRYRFKVKEDDIPGLFTALGCTIHWATPYSGQSKPIERAFRDMCQSIAKDPRLAGAYTGNTPLAKPENYGSRAVPLEAFLTVVAEGIEEHNTRQGRRSEVAWGRSFAEVFDESYAARPIRKATDAQRRLWLLGAEGIKTHKSTGAVWFQGNEFWDVWLQDHADTRVVIRFDPANFWDGVHIYSAAGAYLGHAPVRQKAGFFDMDEARSHARARRAWQNAEKARLESLRLYTATQVGQTLDELAAAAEAPPARVEAKVVRPIFGTASTAAKAMRAASAPPEPDLAATQAGIVADLHARRVAVAPAAEETARDRFKRALEIEDRMRDGHPVTAEQQRWVSVYQTTAEYQGERHLWTDFGDAYFG